MNTAAATETRTSLEVVTAADIRIGDAVTEADGYLFAITAIERKGGVITFTCVNEFSPDRRVRVDGLPLRKRARTRMYVLRSAGWDVAPASVAAAVAANLDTFDLDAAVEQSRAALAALGVNLDA